MSRHSRRYLYLQPHLCTIRLRRDNVHVNGVCLGSNQRADISMCPSSDGQAASDSALAKRPDHLSLRNRILSIYLDAGYVKSLTASIPGTAVIANERCGSWYVSPDIHTDSAYFKSTDGHRGSWSFNTRRLNLSLLDLLGKHARCFLIDSARRKAMSDALSKTVPIWVAVMNRLLFPGRQDCRLLHTDERHVPLTEQTEIESRLDRFLQDAKGLSLDLEGLRQRVKLPIKVHFCSNRDSTETLTDLGSKDFVHLICLSASVYDDTISSSSQEFDYVSGAGDDAEHWAHGLTPALLWTHKHRLSQCESEDDAKRLVDDIVCLARDVTPSPIHARSSLSPIYFTPSSPAFYVGDYHAIEDVRAGRLSIDAAIVCWEQIERLPVGLKDTDQTTGAVHHISVEGSSQSKITVLSLHCPARKLGSRALRIQFQHVEPFIGIILNKNPKPQLLFACEAGFDLAIGVALATACLHIDANGHLRSYGRRLQATNEQEGKGLVRRRLVQILEQTGLDDRGGGGSNGIRRATLTAVNSLVIERPAQSIDAAGSDS